MTAQPSPGNRRTLPAAKVVPPPSTLELARHTIRRLHNLLGHPAPSAFCKMTKSTNTWEPAWTIQLVKDAIGDCLSCLAAKGVRYTHTRKSLAARTQRLHTGTPGSTLSIDFNTFGTISLFHSFKHALTGVSWSGGLSRVFVEFLPNKQPDVVEAALLHMINSLRSLLEPDAPIQMLDISSDQDTSITSSTLADTLAKISVTVSTCTPHEHSTNGRAEVTIRILTTMTRCYLEYASLSLKLWPYAYHTAVFCLNNMPRQFTNGMSSNQLHGIEYDTTKFITWGSDVSSHLPVAQRTHGKLEQSYRPGIFLAYHWSHRSTTYAYKILDLYSRHVVVRSSVTVTNSGPFGPGRIRDICRFSSAETAQLLAHAPFSRGTGRPPANSSFDGHTGTFISNSAPGIHTVSPSIWNLVDLQTQYHCATCTLESDSSTLITTHSSHHDIHCPRFTSTHIVSLTPTTSAPPDTPPQITTTTNINTFSPPSNNTRSQPTNRDIIIVTFLNEAPTQCNVIESHGHLTVLATDGSYNTAYDFDPAVDTWTWPPPNSPLPMPTINQNITIIWNLTDGTEAPFEGIVRDISNSHITVYYPSDSSTKKHILTDFNWQPSTTNNTRQRAIANYVSTRHNLSSHHRLINISYNATVSKNLTTSTTATLSGMAPMADILKILPKSRAAAKTTFYNGISMEPDFEASAKAEFGSMVDMRALSANKSLIRAALDAGAPIIGTTLLISAKSIQNAETGIDMYKKMKQRLILFGNQESISPPHSPTHAHTVSDIAYNIFVAFIVHFQMLTAVTDCSRAFLHATNPRKLLLYISNKNMDEFRRYGLDVPRNSNLLLALKAIYGAQDAGDHFYGLLMDILINVLDFIPNEDDPCLLVKTEDSETVILLVHVDDIPMASTSKTLLSKVVMTIFEHLDLGLADSPITTLLGASFTYYRNSAGIFSVGRSNISKIVDLATQLGLTDRNIVHNVLPSKHAVTMDTPENAAKIAELEANMPYQSTIGKLNHLTNLRPDVLVIISKLGGKRCAPSEHDYFLLEWVVIYLYTHRFEQRINTKSPLEYPELSDASGDAAFNSDIRGRSREGQAHHVLGQLVHFSTTTTQSPVPTSTNGAEIPALANAAKTALYIRRISSFIMSHMNKSYPSLNTPIPVYSDNAGAIKTAEPFYTKSKLVRHMEPKYFFTRELQTTGKITVIKVAGGSNMQQSADFFTKTFNNTALRKWKKKFGIIDPNKTDTD